MWMMMMSNSVFLKLCMYYTRSTTALCGGALSHREAGEHSTEPFRFLGKGFQRNLFDEALLSEGAHILQSV